MRKLGGALLAATVLFLVVSCGGDDDDGGGGRRPDAVAPGATASLTFAGDEGLAGAATGSQVTCSFPAVDGLTIAVLASAADPAYSYRLTVAEDGVLVHVDTGAGPTFRSRTFTGPGVSDFDARRGARIDTELTEASPPAGAVGRVTRLQGTLGCGDQTPGSSTLTLTGETAIGRYDAATLDPVVVECYFASDEVTVIGVARTDAKEVLVMVSLGSTGIGVEEDLEAASSGRYSAPPGSAALTSDGAHADGDAVAPRDDGSPSTLHVEGTAHCGTPVRS
jgi:hypothetical protein